MAQHADSLVWALVLTNGCEHRLLINMGHSPENEATRLIDSQDLVRIEITVRAANGQVETLVLEPDATSSEASLLKAVG